MEELFDSIMELVLVVPQHKEHSDESMNKMPPDNKKEAYVVSGGLAVFTDKVKGQTKKDILNATLLAQLAANKKHNRKNEAQEWYSFYNNILGKLGFVIPGFQFQNYDLSKEPVKLNEIVIKILGTVATQEESKALSATLDAMSKLPSSDKSIDLFNSHAFRNFQVYTCDQSPNGDVTLSLGEIYFSATEQQTKFLFKPWVPQNIQIHESVNKVVLNLDIIERVRSTVSEKLGEKSVTLVARINI